MSLRTAGSAVQDEILAAARWSQDVVIEGLQTWTTAVRSVAPKFPALNLPYADQFPKPETLVTGAYDFAAQLLAAQRDFAQELIQVTAPLVGPGDGA